MEFKYRIHLYHDGKRYVAEVPELPGCKGLGRTYADALQAAECAIASRISSPKDELQRLPTSLSQARAATPMRAVAARKHGAVKSRLIEKYGALSNRQLAAEVGLFERDAPGMLSKALGGRNGSRRVRCAIAIALDELPSKLWPNLPSLTKVSDDRMYIAVKAHLAFSKDEHQSKMEVPLKSATRGPEPH